MLWCDKAIYFKTCHLPSALYWRVPSSTMWSAWKPRLLDSDPQMWKCENVTSHEPFRSTDRMSDVRKKPVRDEQRGKIQEEKRLLRLLTSLTSSGRLQSLSPAYSIFNKQVKEFNHFNHFNRCGTRQLKSPALCDRYSKSDPGIAGKQYEIRSKGTSSSQWD